MVQGSDGLIGGHVTFGPGKICGLCGVVARGHVTFGHLQVVRGHAVDVIGCGVVITGHVIVGHVLGFGHVLFGQLHVSDLLLVVSLVVGFVDRVVTLFVGPVGGAGGVGMAVVDVVPVVWTGSVGTRKVPVVVGWVVVVVKSYG